ncbi:MAG: NAD(P)-binding domain-containing protein [Anaerolineales bacterium]|nr:NAD(P)-binding domain-containing protein [Anaerolineales bacterium]
MNIGMLGTGVVGQTIAAKLAENGHAVTVGTRDVSQTLARTEPGAYGQPVFSAWLKEHPGVSLGSFADAARQAEVVINATSGDGALEAIALAGASNLNSKIIIDISNPLDFSQGMPPSLSVCNTDSLGEQIQRACPEAKVVKTLNTVTASLMVNPRRLADGEHHLFLSGNDVEAKAQVVDWLKEWFGWKHFIDLGDITTARGPEMYLPLWLRLWGALGTGMLNIQVIK